MPSCVMKGCRNYDTKVKKGQGISYHRFPIDPMRVEIWSRIIRIQRKEPFFKAYKNCRVCSAHFDVSDYDISEDGARRKLKKSAVPHVGIELPASLQIERPPSQLDFGDGNVSPITDPEYEETVVVKVEPDFVENVESSVVIQDPLSQTTLEGSFKQLHCHRPGESHLYGQPSTLSGVPVIKQEIDEDTVYYKTKFFRTLEELQDLKSVNENLVRKNQALTKKNDSLAKEIKSLKEKNQNLKKINEEKNTLSLNIEKMKTKNLCVKEKIANSVKKIKDLTEKNRKFEESSSKDVKICEEIEKIENLIEGITRLSGEKGLASERESLVDETKGVCMETNSLVKENKRLKMKIKFHEKRIARLRNICNKKLEIKSNEIKGLKLACLKLRSKYTRPKMVKQ